MRRLQRWLVFLVVTALLTCFGQGRSQHWKYVTTDSEGHHYYLDILSVREVSPDQFQFSLRRDWLMGRFRLDSEARTLTDLDHSPERPDPIAANSVAESLLRELVSDEQKLYRRDLAERFDGSKGSPPSSPVEAERNPPVSPHR